MTTVWTPERAIALAPDASAAKAGQGLATSSKWQALGQDAQAAWGDCQGSGAKPYETAVELEHGVGHCTCPSRKFPCKHALGLLLLVAKQPAVVPVNSPPERVVSWLAGRQTREEKQARKAAAPAAPKVVNAATVQRREDRVARACEELARWLEDQLRLGLAVLKQQPAAHWEARAKQLVDGQAPGLAKMIRQTSALPSWEPGWADHVLLALGRLHLLVEAYTRLDTLEAATQAEVRARIGWTQTREELEARPGVQDVWQVLGQYTREEDHLQARTTWLWGLESNRPARVQQFAPLGRGFDTPFAVGHPVAGRMGFYDGATPLRAQALELVPQVERALAPQGVVGAAGAIATYAQALAANPWLESFPLLLADVVVVTASADEARLVGPDGLAWPLVEQFDALWQLVAAGLGQPLTVFGEWDGRTLTPLGAWTGKDWLGFLPQAARKLPVPVQDATWQALVEAAIVGSERGLPSWPQTDGDLGALLAELPRERPEATLLGAAAAWGLGRLAGWQPAIHAEPLPLPAPADAATVLGAAALSRLQRLLGGEQRALLAEWLEAVAAAGKVVPPVSAIALLAQGEQSKALRSPIGQVLGPSGRWLAAQRPAWRYASGDPGDPAAAWDEASVEARVALLAAWRQADATAARERLLPEFASFPANERLALLEACADTLEPADEPWLDSLLDDKGGDVRALAARLLGRLPTSRRGERLALTLAACITWKKHLLSRATLEVTLPSELTPALVRDGLAAAPRAGEGERANWLGALVAGAPLSCWTQSGHKPDAVIAAMRKSDFAEVLLRGLWAGGDRQAPPEWAAPLLTLALEGQRIDGQGVLLKTAPVAELEPVLLRGLREATPATWPALNTVLAQWPTAWSHALADAWLKAYDRVLKAEPQNFRRLHGLEAAVRRYPTDRVAEAERVLGAQVNPAARQEVEQWLDLLRFRREMHEEIAR